MYCVRVSIRLCSASPCVRVSSLIAVCSYCVIQLVVFAVPLVLLRLVFGVVCMLFRVLIVSVLSELCVVMFFICIIVYVFLSCFISSCISIFIM